MTIGSLDIFPKTGGGSSNINNLTGYPLTVPHGGTGATSFTNGGILIGEGTSPIQSIPLSDGQVLIGSTGSNPVASTLTAGTGISIVSAAGSITISNTSATSITFDTNFGGTASPIAGILNLLGSGIITTTGLGNTVTIDTIPLTNGQLFIGSGGTPVAGTLTGGNGITITPGAGSITISASSTFADQFDTNGGGTATPSGGILNLFGSGIITTSGTGNTVTIQTTSLSNGQLFIGSGGTPVASTLTPGAGISITTGAGSITISNTSASAIQFDGNTGTATLSAGVINIVGNTDGIVSTTATGNTVTIQSTTLTDGQLFIGSTGNPPVASTLTAGTGISIADAPGSITISSSATGLGWVDVTPIMSPKQMVSDTGYIADGVSLITLILPTSPAQGDVVRVAGFGSGGWKIEQNAGQQIFYGSDSTTAGTGGSLQSSNQYDCIELLCITTNTFVALSSIGNITVV